MGCLATVDVTPPLALAVAVALRSLLCKGELLSQGELESDELTECDDDGNDNIGTTESSELGDNVRSGGADLKPPALNRAGLPVGVVTS